MVTRLRHTVIDQTDQVHEIRHNLRGGIAMIETPLPLAVRFGWICRQQNRLLLRAGSAALSTANRTTYWFVFLDGRAVAAALGSRWRRRR